jgi:AMMECR1 domain-containing protein
MRYGDEIDLLRQLRPGTDGLIIEDGSHRALFLPSM